MFNWRRVLSVFGVMDFREERSFNFLIRLYFSDHLIELYFQRRLKILLKHIGFKY